MKEVAWSRPDLNPAPLPDLLHKLDLEDRTGILLGGHPKTLTLWVDTSGVLGLDLVANLTDANGQPCDCQFGALDGPGWTQLGAPVLFAQPVAYPLRFRGLSFQGAAESDGTVAISDLGVDGTELESFSKSTGWSATDPHGGSLNLPLLSSQLVPRQGLSTVTITLARGDGDFILRPPPVVAAIPALASSSTMAAFNLIENAPFTAYINGYAVEMIIVGVANNFPTLYQGQGPWIVADLEPLLVGLAQTSPSAVWPNQAWYNVDLAADSHDLGVAKHSFPNANILDRRGLDAAAASDPVRLGLESNLLIGAITALALGIAAFALYFLVVARGRLKEYAVLEGGGMPRVLIWRSLFVEQLIVLGFSLGTGLVLGLLLAFVLLPSLQLGVELFDIVPATVVTIDARLVLAVLGAVALAALLISRLSTRVGGHYRLMDELRSGSGKTTLLNVLAAMEVPSAGTARVAGFDLTNMTAEQKDHYHRKTVGYLWQNVQLNLIPELSAEANVQFPMLGTGLPAPDRRKRASSLLEAFGILHRAKHRPSQLSLGENQRLGLAISLANDPALLLADEPTSQLDKDSARGVLEDLHAVQRESGTTVVIVTHDRKVERDVDRVVAIRDGRTSTETRWLSDDTSTERVILDRAGRMQIPSAYVEKLGLRRKVKVRLEGNEVIVSRNDEVEGE